MHVPDNGGVAFVPAFSGLFAPYWRSDARGAIVGLSRFNTRAHIARATLEAICYQSRDVVEAMTADSGVRLEVLKVDGSVTAKALCIQVQAHVLVCPVTRPTVPDTTAPRAALSRFNTRAHIARATLEAICYQSRDVVEAMTADSGVRLEVLKVDGGVTANALCMQVQADVLGVPVSRPKVPETTALGAAYAAGLSVGFWRDTDELRQ